MKIVDVRAHPLRSPVREPYAISYGRVTHRSATVVEVVTDEGITGWGEALCQALQPPEIAAATVEAALRPLLLGADPLDTEPLWLRMYHHTRDYGRKGGVMGAISGVDIALWDIAGKVYGQPVWRLLGGRFRDRVRAYATSFYRLQGQGEAARLADEARQVLAEGFTAMKVKLGFGVEDDLAVMEAILDAVADRGATVMIDANHAYGVADAVRLGQALDRHRLRWYEEPVAPEDVAGYREVRRKVSTPIAGGENEHGAYGFRDLLCPRAIDVAQPDIAAAGGFTGCRHVLTLAQAAHVQVNPHVWGAGVAQAAALQLLAVIPPAEDALLATEPVYEYDRGEHPFRTELVDRPVVQRAGWIDVPSRPGIGVEVDRDALSRWRSDGR